MSLFERSLPLSFEPLIPEPSDVIVSESESDAQAYRTFAKRRRVEDIARRYVAGHPVEIFSAKLKGPFDGGWVNPWNKRPARATSTAHSERAAAALAPRGTSRGGLRESRSGVHKAPLPKANSTKPHLWPDASSHVGSGGQKSATDAWRRQKPEAEVRRGGTWTRRGDDKRNGEGQRIGTDLPTMHTVAGDGRRGTIAHLEDDEEDDELGPTEFRSNERQAGPWLKTIKGSAYSKPNDARMTTSRTTANETGMPDHMYGLSQLG